VTVRPASPGDVARVAELHVARIDEGFLASLGPRFLRRLYRRVTRSADAFLLVAVEGDEIVGFIAGASDLRRFYRSFLARDAIVAGFVAAPRLLRSAPRALETLRYPAEAGELPSAEILSVAVDEGSTGQGVGRALVAEGVAELRRRGVLAAKVVAGADNAAALRLYEGAGFARRRRIAVHRDTASEVLVWSSSSA
jgi:ribosomal protein S18 acetylase RimI-like enzyme